MKSSFYFKWFRRLAVLGAVVAAGAFASTAGAVGRPPDIQDIARANLAADVSRPPDTGDVAARLSASVPDVFERYAAEHPYGRGLAVTSAFVVRPPDVQDTADSVNATRAWWLFAGRQDRSRRSSPGARRHSTSGCWRCTVDPDRRVERLPLERLGDRDRHRDGACSPPRRRVPDEQATAAPRAARLGSPPRTDRAGRQGPLDLPATPSSRSRGVRGASHRRRSCSGPRLQSGSSGMSGAGLCPRRMPRVIAVGP